MSRLNCLYGDVKIEPGGYVTIVHMFDFYSAGKLLMPPYPWNCLVNRINYQREAEPALVAAGKPGTAQQHDEVTPWPE